eukprot:TRINITY_DN355_c9_g1_i1.p1 TRINITY_DN355_c9_g1~~TRINITY_DN355_c9_g1_i1.p1  ORF type:complete len:101 (+),score=25.47 TRINITY_DN355_c9_g1_i1:555-857(+)
MYEYFDRTYPDEVTIIEQFKVHIGNLILDHLRRREGFLKKFDRDPSLLPIRLIIEKTLRLDPQRRIVFAEIIQELEYINLLTDLSTPNMEYFRDSWKSKK